jgi:hypothetical protein
MNHEWVPQTPDELRRHAKKLEAIAAFVSRPDVAFHLKEEAAAVLAEAALREAAANEASSLKPPCIMPGRQPLRLL